MKREVFIKKIILISLFILYIILLVNINLLKFIPIKDFKSNFNYFSIMHLENRLGYCNFIPCASFKTHFNPTLDLIPIFKNFIIGVVFFTPFGFFIPFVNKRYRTIHKVLKLTICFSFFIEFTKFIYGLGDFNIDNILLNILGSTIGFFYVCTLRKKRFKEKRASKIKYKTIEI